KRLLQAWLKTSSRNEMPDAVDEIFFRQGEGQAGVEKLRAFAAERPDVQAVLGGVLDAPVAPTVAAPRSAGSLGIIGDISDAPVTDTRGQLLSRAERIALGGAPPDVPMPKLSTQGEAARQAMITDLAARKNTARGMTPATAMEEATGQIDALISRRFKAGDVDEADLVPPEVRSVARQANDVLGTWERINLLMSPLTHFRNILGTGGTAPWKIVEDTIAPVIEPLFARAGYAKEGRHQGEQLHRIRGWYHAGAAASREFLATLARGDEALEVAQTGQASRAPTGRTVLDAAEKGLGVLFRPLSAADAYFRTVYEGGDLYARAYRHTKGQGLTGKVQGDEMLRFMQQPDDATVQAIERQGKYSTFTQDMDKVGDWVAKLGQIPGIGPNIAPFVKTPYNALKYDMERSPLGVASVVKAGMSKSTTSGEMADRTARTMAGSFISYTLYRQAEEGNITGPLPDSQPERDAWQAEGKKPWHIRIGGSWWNYGIIPGVNANLATAALLANAKKQGTVEGRPWNDVAGRFALEMVGVLAQKPLLGTLAGLMESIDRPANAAQFFERFGAQIAQQNLPASSALRYVENITDPMLRNPQGVVERVQAGIPGLAQNLPIKRDAFGSEMARDQTGWEAALNPFRRSDAREGIRQYRGSDSAEMDRTISRALSAVADYDRAPREYPRPTQEQRRLANRFDGRELDRYQELRSKEKARERQAQTARAGGR
ncbi:MAG TPA: hypothetical protein VNM48_01015, partial [Chloroflexota bacterium]|nr:hypothetical protein [Chloroflexota bacterium]